MLERIKDEMSYLLAGVLDIPADDIRSTIEPGKVGDFSSKIAFVLSKEKKENPTKLAAEITSKLKKHLYFEKVESAGPYINFYLSNKAYSLILSDILSKKDKYGSGKNKKQKIIIEFPAVNPNKPWHIGHLRNAVLGSSVAQILEFDGYDVERMDYIDDLGLQVAQSLWGFLNYDSNPKGKLDFWLGEQYVGIAKKFEEDKTIVEGVRNVLKAIEEGDNEIAEAGRKLAEQCVLAQYETAFNFGVFHDVLVFESDIMRTIFKDGVKYLHNCKSVVVEKEGKNAGCLVVKLIGAEFNNLENPDKVLVRSDGTAVYTGKDIIFHLWKFGKLKSNFTYVPFTKQPNGKTAYMTSPKGKPMDFAMTDKAINVIGVEQKYPQQVIVEVFKKLGFADEASNLRHLSYEHVGLPEAKFSGRKGTWIGYTADNLLEEAQEKVIDKIKIEFSDKDKKKIAKLVGVAAIRFSFLRTNADKRITFKWEEALNMEGDSGPYAQYAYVRAKAILAKTTKEPDAVEIEFNDSEKKVIKQLAIFSDYIGRASRELTPHHITQYVLDVAAGFSSFYASSPVLAAEDKEVVKARLAITAATSIVLKNALRLLVIECPEKM
ncbi:arginine--tRNA ligase [Candidatus Micrarchaeota archaeon]|nr:arginine--tRNA ligase [Candidatus Micrarchaeota archaeon]MBU1166000.1 arginine--tRNA ligase [Candidatus Micrarchaeota archaeon]MBU1886780.1 arginine--tRNA ligase [Candidatus Micrarchaeota archaeon]